MAPGNSQSSPILRVTAWVVLSGLLFGAGSLTYPWTVRDIASSAYIGTTILAGGTHSLVPRLSLAFAAVTLAVPAKKILGHYRFSWAALEGQRQPGQLEALGKLL